LVQDFLTFDGGGLGANTTTAYDMGTTRGVTVLAGGAYFGATAATVVITIGAPIVGTNGGDVTVEDQGPFANNAHNAGAILNLTNTNNSWNGNLILSGGTGSAVRAGTSNVIPDSAIVNMAASGNTFDMATNNTTETVKSITGTAGTIAIGNGSLTVANPSGETYSSVLTSSATGKFIKNGAGALTLSGNSTGFLGEMILNAGTFGVGGAGAFGSGVGAQLTINGGKLANNSATNRNLNSNLAVNLNADFTVDDSLNGTPGQINFQGTNTIKNSDRTITVSGAATTLAFGSAVGQDSPGRSITKEGSGTLALNAANTYSGNTQVNAGTVSIDADGTLGDGTGTLVLNGGRLNTTASRTTTSDPVANPVNVTANSELTTTSGAATVQLNLSSNSIQGTAGTTLTIRNDAATGTGAFLPRFTGSGFDYAGNIDLAAGSQDVNRTVTMQSFNSGNTTQTFSGTISGSGSFNRTASSAGTGGTTVFTGANTYSGGTTINDGTLAANNTSGSATGSGAVTINNGGTLAGSGAVAGNVVVNTGGNLSPGNSIESLGLGGDLSFDAGSTLVAEVDSSAALSVAADLVTVGGNLSITSGALMSLSDIAATSQLLANTTKLTLIAYSGAWNLGLFNLALDNSLIADDSVVTIGVNQYVFDYNDTSAGLNFTADLPANASYVTLTAIPEPTAFLFGGLACGLIGLIHFGRKYMARRMVA
jgi:autotransporter-associated beta strand protein